MTASTVNYFIYKTGGLTLMHCVSSACDHLSPDVLSSWGEMFVGFFSEFSILIGCIALIWSLSAFLQ